MGVVAIPLYSYIAVDRKGRELKGTIDAENRERAVEELKQQGLIIAELDNASALSKDINIGLFKKRPKARDLSVFCRQFVSIIDAGVSVVSALEMLGEQTENKMLKAAVFDTRTSIEKGESLANAMRPHVDVFSDMLITLVEAGEASGSLDISFNRMAEQFEKSAKLKATVKKATIYPIVLAIVAVAVIILMLTFVIPTFENMFAQMGSTLPLLTRVIIAASRYMQKQWYIVVGAIIGVVVGIKYFAGTTQGKYFFGKIAMKLPLFGKLVIKTSSARMARTLSTLVAAGIPLIEAIEIASQTMTNVYFRDALIEAKNDVAVGAPLSEPLSRGKLFPALVYQMLKIGEETGNIEGMLTKLAEYYDDEVDMTTQQLMAAMEPAIIVVMAVVIGTMVLAIILPMGQMYADLDKL